MHTIHAETKSQRQIMQRMELHTIHGEREGERLIHRPPWRGWTCRRPPPYAAAAFSPTAMPSPPAPTPRRHRPSSRLDLAREGTAAPTLPGARHPPFLPPDLAEEAPRRPLSRRTPTPLGREGEEKRGDGDDEEKEKERTYPLLFVHGS